MVSALFAAGLSSEHSKRIAARKLPAFSLLMISAVRWESSLFGSFDRVGRCGIDCGVGLSLQSPSLLRMMLARFLVAPFLAGLASIARAIEKRYFHACKFVGVEMILRRILRRPMAHVIWAALGTLVMSWVQGGDAPLRMVRPWCHQKAGSLERTGNLVNYPPIWLTIASCKILDMVRRWARHGRVYEAYRPSSVPCIRPSKYGKYRCPLLVFLPS